MKVSVRQFIMISSCLLHLLLFVAVGTTQDFTEDYQMKGRFLLDLQQYFYIKWIVLFNAEDSGRVPNKLYLLWKFLYTNSSHYVSSWSIHDVEKDVVSRAPHFVPIIVLDFEDTLNPVPQQVNQLLRNEVSKRYVWTCFGQEDSEDLLSQLDIEHGCIFIDVVPEPALYRYNLTQVYHHWNDSSLIKVNLGTWTLNGGLDIKRISFD